MSYINALTYNYYLLLELGTRFPIVAKGSGGSGVRVEAAKRIWSLENTSSDNFGSFM